MEAGQEVMSAAAGLQLAVSSLSQKKTEVKLKGSSRAGLNSELKQLQDETGKKLKLIL